jgi:predicted phage terminase large subunit-like protein
MNYQYQPDFCEPLGTSWSRPIAEANIAFFAHYYRNQKIPAHQRRWYRILDEINDFSDPLANRLLKLAPRDHGKTEVFTITYPLYCILRDPEVRILILSKTSTQAKKCLSVIKRELETNERIREDFGDLISPDLPWSQTAIYCRRSRQSKDPTVEVVGALGAITGGHFDLIVADDIVDDENTKTAKRRQDTYDWFHGTIMQLAEPATQVIVVGTRKHYDDLYSRLMENPLWVCDIDRAIVKWPDKYEYIEDEAGQVVDVVVDGSYEVLWPEKWDIKTLLLDRLATVSLLFDREKQNVPARDSGAFLLAKWLKYYNDEERPPLAELNIYQGVDLALSEGEEADWTAIATVGRDADNHLWLLDIYRARLSFPEQLRAVSEQASRWKPLIINLESNAYQAALHQQLLATTTLPVRAGRTIKDKKTRFAAMAVHFESGRIRIRKGLDEFVKEWLEFPTGRHDDTLDAVEKALEVALSDEGKIQMF